MTDPTDAEALAEYNAIFGGAEIVNLRVAVGHALLRLTRERDEARAAGFQMHVHDSSPGLEREVAALRARLAARNAESGTKEDK